MAQDYQTDARAGENNRLWEAGQPVDALQARADHRTERCGEESFENGTFLATLALVLQSR